MKFMWDMNFITDGTKWRILRLSLTLRLMFRVLALVLKMAKS